MPFQILMPPTHATIELPPLQNLFPDAAPKVKDALNFYERNYTSVGQWILDPKEKVVLRSILHPGICRFCGQGEPQVTFRDVAHALPESSGNKSLSTDYECDTCNHIFGDGIENDFGNWSKAQRALSGVRGKNGIPAMKGKEWHFEHNATTGITVTQSGDGQIAVPNESGTHITLKVPRDPFTPVAVLKTFAKMALSLLPEEELPRFQRAMMWIRNPDHQAGLVKVSGFPVLYTFVPGSNPLTNSALLLRRNDPNLQFPYMFLVITYGNEIFQVAIPSPEMDRSLSLSRDKLLYFPNPYELDSSLVPAAPIQRELIDLTGRDLVKGELIETILRIE
jgi:HNH endonuclease